MSKGLRVIKENNNLAEWSRQVEECRSSGLSVRAWCEQAHIAVSTFHYRQQKVWKALQRQNQFVEVPVSIDQCCSTSIAATVQIGEVRADIHNGADEATLVALFHALNSYDLILFLEPDVKFVQDGDRSEIIRDNRRHYSDQIKQLLKSHGKSFIEVNRICRTKSYQSKPSISQGFKKFNFDAVSKKPLPKEEKKPKPDPVEEARKKHEDELREFDENDGYLKFDGAGFNERPDRSGLAELALDTANGYPQLTWAYYERNAEHGNSIVLGSAPLPQEKINNITPRDVVQFISEQSKNLPPYVVIDYDKIKKNEYLELWCEIVKELRS